MPKSLWLKTGGETNITRIKTNFPSHSTQNQNEKLTSFVFFYYPFPIITYQISYYSSKLPITKKKKKMGKRHLPPTTKL